MLAVAIAALGALVLLSVMILLAQNALDFDLVAQGYGLGVYMAIGEFFALASNRRETQRHKTL